MCPIVPVTPTDELPHGPGVTDEWLFAAWAPDASLGLLSGHRVTGSRAWYWSAFVQAREPLLHLAEWDARVRADPFIVKAPEMWAEHHCVAPLEQWTIGNEAFFVALDDADEAIGRAYGTPTATAMDLEWYATRDPVALDDGFSQDGTVHGRIDVMGRTPVELAEVPAMRWRRWRTAGTLATLSRPGVLAVRLLAEGVVAGRVRSRRVQHGHSTSPNALRFRATVDETCRTNATSWTSTRPLARRRATDWS